MSTFLRDFICLYYRIKLYLNRSQSSLCADNRCAHPVVTNTSRYVGYENRERSRAAWYAPCFSWPLSEYFVRQGDDHHGQQNPVQVADRQARAQGEHGQ